MSDVYLVTGAMGCFGSWVLHHLAAAGERVVALDLDIRPVRPALLMSAAQLNKINFVQGDLTDLTGLKSVMETWQVSHVIHVAALQIPFCRNNPPLGARVNVEGTINILEAVRSRQADVKGLVYASSVAVFGPESFYPTRPVPDSAPLFPQTLYGVYKQADENAARVYWQDWHIASIGLRPYTAYGVARDQGTTSDLTKAILAAVAGRPYHIRFDGMVALQYASDIAQILIACARAGFSGAATCNLRNDVISVHDFINVVRAEIPGARLTCEPGKPLPFPSDLDDGGLRGIIGTVPHTPLVQAVHETTTSFRSLLAQNRIDLAQLDG
jgi:nucleoside-diphosphate-sugar epimerase